MGQLNLHKDGGGGTMFDLLFKGTATVNKEKELNLAPGINLSDVLAPYDILMLKVVGSFTSTATTSTTFLSFGCNTGGIDNPTRADIRLDPKDSDGSGGHVTVDMVFWFPRAGSKSWYKSSRMANSGYLQTLTTSAPFTLHASKGLAVGTLAVEVYGCRLTSVDISADSTGTATGGSSSGGGSSGDGEVPEIPPGYGEDGSAELL